MIGLKACSSSRINPSLMKCANVSYQWKGPDKIQEVIINYFRIFICIIFLPFCYPLCIHLPSFLSLISVTLKLWKWQLCPWEDSFQHRATTCIGAWNYTIPLKQRENDETHTIINLLHLL
jgi:hypothetical protein